MKETRTINNIEVIKETNEILENNLIFQVEATDTDTDYINDIKKRKKQMKLLMIQCLRKEYNFHKLLLLWLNPTLRSRKCIKE